MFFSYFATKVTLQYEFAKLLPSNDKTFIDYEDFKKDFGQDGMVVVIATKDDQFFTEEKFNAWRELGDSLIQLTTPIYENGELINKSIVDSIFSEAHLYNIQKYYRH